MTSLPLPWIAVDPDPTVPCPDLSCAGVDLSVPEVRAAAVRMAAVASSMLYQRSGCQFGGLASAQAHLCVPLRGWRGIGWSNGAAGYGALFPSYGPWLAPWGPWGDGWACGRDEAVQLPHGPVAAVSLVMVDGVTLDPSAYQLDGDRLFRCDGGNWPRGCGSLCAGDGLYVEWTFGNAPPLDGKLAASALACELLKTDPSVTLASTLPAGVTSVTKQGATWTRDLLALLDRGLTGITLVDLFLGEYLNRGAGVLFPDLDTHHRRNPIAYRR